MRKLYLLILSLMMPGMLLAQAVTYPNHFTVAQDGSGDFKTIQEAVNAMRDLSQQQVSIYQSKGNGAEAKGRVPWSHQLSAVDFKKYTVKNILAGNDNWDVSSIK